MTGQDRAARVRRLFDELVGLGAGERDTRLTEECGSDEALRREVESLLAAAETGASDVGHALRSLRPRPEDDRDEPAFAGDHPPAALRAALEDRYVVEAEIGRGGMATVYRAHDRKHNRRVALKVLTPELAAVLGHGRFLAGGFFDVWTIPSEEKGALTTDLTGRDSTVLDRSARPWLEAAWDQMETRVSPDGTLAAYVSSESGQKQIVVQTFPQAGRIWRASESATGAYSPRWAADGRSLYFWVRSDISPDTLFKAGIHKNGTDLRIDTPEPVLTLNAAGGLRNAGIWWDVDPSGGGFVIAVTEDLTGGRPGAGDERRYVIVQNWLTELKERMEQARR